MNDTFTSHISTLKTHFAPKIKIVLSAKSLNTFISTQEPVDLSEGTSTFQTLISCFQVEQVHALEQVFLEKVVLLKLHKYPACYSVKLPRIYQCLEQIPTE